MPAILAGARLLMMISVDDFLLFCNRTLDGYERALAGLDDEQLNTLPPLPNPNSPAQLVVHALGAGWWWTTHIVLGAESSRNRDAEFETIATRDELIGEIAEFRAGLARYAGRLAAATELAKEPQTQTPLGAPWTVGAALIHAYEELAQHLGHLEITVDLLADR